MGYYARIIARMATTTMEALVLRAPLSFFSSFDFLKLANSYLVALGQSTGLSRIESDLANFAQVLLFSMSQISRPQG